MARAGIYKSEVLRARDKLLSLGRYPSIDAIRTELGNTGSKGTIHRFLKEIEEEEGGATGAQVAISEALQDLVARLASRLQDEADVRVTQAEAKHAEQAQKQAQAQAALTQELDGFRSQLERAELALADERRKNEQAEATLRAQSIELAQRTQQIQDLQDRVAAEERHRQSLEEKHQHACDALAHFRQAAKEQREQEHRQHEQQTQYLQAEVRRLNEALASKLHELTATHQDNVRLAAELKATRSEMRQAQEETQRVLIQSQAEAQQLRTLNLGLEAKAADMVERNRELNRELEVARSTVQVQESAMSAILLRLGPVENPQANQ